MEKILVNNRATDREVNAVINPMANNVRCEFGVPDPVTLTLLLIDSCRRDFIVFFRSIRLFRVQGSLSQRGLRMDPQ